MLPRNRYSGLTCGLALLLAAVPGRAQAAEAISPEMRQTLRAAQTVRLEVRQDYDLIVEKAEEMAEGDKDEEDKSEGNKNGEDKSVVTKPEEAKPEGKYSLPLEELAAEAIKLAGWKVVQSGEPADVTLIIEVHGTPLGADYIGTLSGFFYTGAKLQGSVRLEAGGQVVTAVGISATIPVASSIHSYSFGYHAGPRDAPFRQTLSEFCEAVFTVIGRACGPGPVLTGLKLENDDQRAGASRALLEVGDASVEPILIQILGQDNAMLARIAALGLGVHGRATALPPLLAILRKDKSDAALASYKDPSDDELLRSLTDFQEEILRPTERAAAAREMLDNSDAMHRAVEWALLQIEAPEKFNQLTAALQSPDSVMLRRGAAVVLGSLADQRAFAPLATAARDKEPLVRAAAVAALGRLKDELSVDVFLAASADATEYVSKLAREQLAEAGEKRWEDFLRSRTLAAAAWSEISVRVLLDGLAHPDPLVRAAAARATVYRTEPEIKAGLAALLQSDPQAFVREAVAASLAEARDDSNASILARALGDTDAATRRHAVQALTENYEGGDDSGKKVARSRLPETALVPLLALLARHELDAVDAGKVLERIAGPGVADTLLQALQEDRPPVVTESLAHELVRRGDQRAVPPLLAQLVKAKDANASQFVADALVAFGDPAVLEPLFAQLKTGTTAARRLALNVLGKIRQPRAIGPLIAALRAAENAGVNDPARGLGGDAQQALQSLTGKFFARGEEWLRWWKENSGKPFVLPPVKAPVEEAPPTEPTEEKT